MDDGRSMVEGLMSPSDIKPNMEEDDILKSTRDLLASLKNDASNIE